MRRKTDIMSAYYAEDTVVTYIHELPRWPDFQWDQATLTSLLADVRHRQGRLLGRMEGLGFLLRNEAVLQTLTQDVLKSSEIEGEVLDPDQVRSSIARRLGMDIGALTPADRHVDGIVEMMLDATSQYGHPLTEERLFGWHAAMFPTGYSGMLKITVGEWRTDAHGPMQVVSGPIGLERVHYEAPEAARLPEEMKAFIQWFDSEQPIDPVLKAGLAHLWFVTLHPFEDGNGRIGRAVADMALARSEESAQRFYSLSAQIRQERNDYYTWLERTQKGGMDVTPWLRWFLECLSRAIEQAENTLGQVLRKADYWNRLNNETLNDRQRQMINRLLDGFEGNLTSSKWAKITKSSQDTAYRDILDLVDKGILSKNPEKGRSTSYSLVKSSYEKTI
jgi:Fic family protein